MNKIGANTIIFDDKIWIRSSPEQENFNQIQYTDIVKIDVLDNKRLFIDCGHVKHSFIMRNTGECLNVSAALRHAILQYVIFMGKKPQESKKTVSLTITIDITK